MCVGVGGSIVMCMLRTPCTLCTHFAAFGTCNMDFAVYGSTSICVKFVSAGRQEDRGILFALKGMCGQLLNGQWSMLHSLLVANLFRLYHREKMLVILYLLLLLLTTTGRVARLAITGRVTRSEQPLCGSVASAY